MNAVNKTTCAPYNPSQTWKAINWLLVEKRVKQLQMRIAKAVREGKYGKVQSLQWILTHSYYAKLLAVKRVVTNKGKKTSGVDGVIWKTPKQKMEAVKTLKRRGYRPLPLRRVHIPKKRNSKKKRPLGIPTMRDRAMQALYSLALIPVSETVADINSYGFREERCCQDAIEQCYIALAKTISATWILEGDIVSCFDEINHKWLLDNIPIDKKILQLWLKAGYIDNKRRFPTEKGTPQGGIISPIISNMTLDGLEKTVREAVPKGSKVNFIRYADDFIVTCVNKEIIVDKIIPTVKSFLLERGLKLSPEKTLITHIENGFDFLSQTVRKYDGKYLTKPSKKAIKSFMDSIRKIIRSMRGASAEALIKRLNAAIRGWVNYHKHIVAKHTFRCIDSQIYSLLVRWAKRRHSKKSWHWICSKYFRHGTIKGAFSIKVKTKKKGVYKIYQIYKAAYTPIRRHIKIRQLANPYDPEYKSYFEQRRKFKRFRAYECRQITTHLAKA